MKVTSYYPVLATANLAAAREFYERLFGLTARYANEWYVHLAHPEHEFVILALVAKDHESIPARGRTAAAGLLINFEVSDVDAEHQRLVAAGAEVLLPLRDEPWGQRHFILAAPDGALIDVITPIAPSEEYAGAYVA